jgi:hypothetical protein
VKSLAADRSRWKSFVAALCSSTGDNRKWWWWCRTPWAGVSPVARPLPTHRTTHWEETRTDIHASSGIRTHNPTCVWAGGDISCLRPRWNHLAEFHEI